jgi:hypothetical protein
MDDVLFGFALGLGVAILAVSLVLWSFRSRGGGGIDDREEQV